MTTAAEVGRQTKILIAGDVNGKLGALYKRVASVNASAAGPFDALFCVGPFFSPVGGSLHGTTQETAAGVNGDVGVADGHEEIRAYVEGRATAPIPTYFVEGLPTGREFCRDPDGAVAPNITFLGKPGVHLLHGLKVAVLPGRYNAIAYRDASKVAASAAAAEGEYRNEDVQAVKAAHFADGCATIDLLLTAEWPTGVCAFARDAAASAPAVAAAAEAGSPVVAELARDLQPRYHAAGRGGVFFAREPYRNPKHHVTRFVGLGATGNKEKQKWLHALGLAPANALPPAALHQLPPDTTQCPYNIPVTAVPKEGGANVSGGADFDHAQVRWEEPKAKKARIAASIDRRPIQGDVDKTIYVKNLAYRADEGAIAEYFGQCGDLVDLRLGRDDNGRSRGFCHVAFATADAAERALQLSESNFFGRDILVEMAKSEETRNAERDARRAEQRARRPPPPPPTGCWFCLSNEKDLHLVASIANESFVSMDKGGVVADHCQVVPVEHVPSFAAMAPSTAEEVFRYIAAVREMFAAGCGCAPVLEGEPSAGAGPGPGAEEAADGAGETKTRTGGPRDLVVFERHLALRSKGGNHCHMNCIPVPRTRALKARKIFEQAAQRLNFEWEVIAPPESAADAQAAIAAIAGDGEYYAVHLPDRTMLVRKIGRGEPHWMSFGREVLGHLLGCPERTSWQNCMEDEAAEEKRTAAFKAAFTPFDIMQG